MLKDLYKKMLGKMGLSNEQLRQLQGRLYVSKVPEGGQFIDGEKKCPNTHPIAILANNENLSKQETKDYLKKLGITFTEMWTFYFLYDVPAILSRKPLEKRLVVLRGAIDEMIDTRSPGAKI
jgi:CRISPR/Cas system CSM-associated protein Csm4 (group 5 of RAMP superfamily)